MEGCEGVTNIVPKRCIGGGGSICTTSGEVEEFEFKKAKEICEECDYHFRCSGIPSTFVLKCVQCGNELVVMSTSKKESSK